MKKNKTIILFCILYLSFTYVSNAQAYLSIHQYGQNTLSQTVPLNISSSATCSVSVNNSASSWPATLVIKNSSGSQIFTTYGVNSSYSGSVSLGAGNYSVTLSYPAYASGFSGGATATISIPPPPSPPTINSISPSSQSINYNTQPQAITVSASGGNGSYSYEWKVSFDYSTWTTVGYSSSYQPPTLTSTAQYQVIVTSNGLSASTTARVTVYSQLSPGSVWGSSSAVNYGDGITVYSNSASGGDGNYSYQWQYSYDNSSWSNISGANSTSYSTGGLTSGTYYRMVVTSNGVAVGSNSVYVTVYPQLSSGGVWGSASTINYGASATVYANSASGGNGSYSYQWQSSGDNSSWGNISGANSTSYGTGSLTSGTYYRIISSSNGVSVASGSVYIGVYPPLASGSVWANSSTINFNSSTIVNTSGASGGNGSYSFQWQYSYDNSSWSNISGATGTSYNTGTLTSSTYYRVIAGSNGVSVASSSVLVGVYPPLVSGNISSLASTINYGTSTVIMTNGASGGSGSYSYQWQSSTDNNTWSNINGATGTSYNTGGLTTSIYYRVVSSSSGISVASAGLRISVYPPLVSGTASTSPSTVNYGATAILSTSIASGGSGSYSYQWQSSSDNSTWSNISGATGTSYTTGALTAGIYYRVVSTSNGVSVNSNSVLVSVYPQLVTGSVSASPSTVNYNTSSVVSVSGTSGGSGSYSYQWQSSSDNSTWSSISGATGTSYTTAVLTSGVYFRVVTTSNGVSVNSNGVLVSVYPQLVSGSVSASPSTVNYNTSSVVSVSGTSGGNGTYSYQWQSSSDNSTWTSINGATGSSYTTIGLSSAMYYRIVTTSNGVNVTSSSFKVSVYPQLVASSVTASPININYNTTSTLTTISASGGNGLYTYQWQSSSDNVSWSNVTGATSLSIVTSNLTTSTYFRHVVTSNGVSVYSGSIRVIVYPQLIAGSLSSNPSTTNFNAPSLISSSTPSGGNSSYTYQWQSSLDSTTWNNILGATNVNYTTDSLMSPKYYRVQETSNGVTVTTNGIKISVYPLLVSGIANASQGVVNYASSANLNSSLPTGGNGSYTYQWQSSNDNTTWSNISSANTLNYNSTSMTSAVYYRVIASSNGVSVNSNSVQVNVYPQIKSGAITPGTQDVKSSGLVSTMTLSGVSGGNGSYSYQWQSLGSNGIWANITGATDVSYNPVSVSSSTSYRVLVTSNGASLPSSTTSVNVNVIGYPNYVMSYNATAPETNSANISNRSISDVKLITQYIDGIGRPIQSVAMKASLETSTGNNVDLVEAKVYDSYGREQLKYLPYASTSSDGSYKSSALIEQNNYYSGTNSPIAGQGESVFNGQVIFEPSPLNRTLKTMSAGNSWVGAGRGIQQGYYYNTSIDGVRYWTVGSVSNIGDFSTYASSNEYAVGTLYKTVVTDESNHQVIEFKDMEGKIVLKKIQLTATADNGNGSGHAGWACSYYIYDGFGNLRAVIQPEGVKAISNNNWQLTTLQLAEQCFRYEYDGRKHMIMKQVPGAGPVYMVYDQRDLLVMTQDANMRNSSNWLITVYDNLKRPVQTLMMSNSNSFASMLSAASTTVGYPSNISGAKLLTQTHYDDYSDLPTGLTSTMSATGGWSNLVSATNLNAGGFPYPILPTKNSVYSTKGLVTWTTTNVVGTNNYLSSTSIFDDKSRPIQVQTQNITGGLDVTTTQYTWSGQPLIMVESKDKEGNNVQTSTLVTSMTYDYLGRVLTVQKQVGNSQINSGSLTSKVLVASNQYDALGKLKLKQIGRQRNADNSYATTPLETLNYDYNIRGWLLGINRAYVRDLTSTNNAGTVPTRDLISGESFTNSTTGAPIYSNTNYFGFDLGYDKVSNNLINSQSYLAAQYNGNITGTVWKSAVDNQVRKFDYTYDLANRLTGATYNEYIGSSFNTSSNVDFSVNGLTYDYNGNILSMNQLGLKSGATSFSVIDQLSYGYVSGTNKLQTVVDLANDNSSTLGDFKYDPATKTNTDYTYDVNGNMISDKNKNITGISYNYLNLPDTIVVAGKGTIVYTHDASGNKLQKKTIDNMVGKTTITTYLGGSIFQNDTLQYLPQEEGRIRLNAANTGYIFDYFVKDHLGNTRMVLTDDGNRINPILEATHYYPFGLTMKAISSQAAGALENKFRYNGGNELQSKEFSDGSGLEIYDAVHRMYDPQVGRFIHLDPLSDLTNGMSSYVFGNNNPVTFNDPFGLVPDSTDSKGNVWHGLDDAIIKSSRHGKSTSIGFNWPTSTKNERDAWDENQSIYYHRLLSGKSVINQGDAIAYTRSIKMYNGWINSEQEYKRMQLFALGIISSPALLSISPSIIFSALKLKLTANFVAAGADIGIQSLINGTHNRSILRNWNPASTVISFAIGAPSHSISNIAGVSVINATFSNTINVSLNAINSGEIFRFDPTSIIINSVFGTVGGVGSNGLKVDFKSLNLGEAASQPINLVGASIDSKVKDN